MAITQLIRVDWVVRLRWLIALAQLGLLTAAAAGWTETWNLTTIGIVLIAGVSSNIALEVWTRKSDVTTSIIIAMLVMDTLLLTATLAATGGPSNPFSVLFLYPVVLAALLVGPTWTWIMVAATSLAYAGLFYLTPMSVEHHHGGDAAMASHLVGMWLAYAVTGPLIAFATMRIRSAWDEAQAGIAHAQHLKIRTERLASLATLAAGAAHELATPLSTIAILSHEVGRRHPDDGDLGIIEEQIARCRDILDNLAMDAGTGMAETPVSIDVHDLIDEALDGQHYDPVTTNVETGDTLVRLPVRLVSQAMRRLLGNARDASAAEPIELSAAWHDKDLVITIRDHGAGMPSDVLERATEPFFTTKAKNGGTGLGLYYVSAVVEQLEGALEIESTPEIGTTAVLRLPCGGQREA